MTDAALLARAAAGAVIVVRHSMTRREDLDTAREALAGVNARVLGAVVNLLPMSSKDYGYSYGYGYQPRSDAPRLDDEVRIRSHLRRSCS